MPGIFYAACSLFFGCLKNWLVTYVSFVTMSIQIAKYNFRGEGKFSDKIRKQLKIEKLDIE